MATATEIDPAGEPEFLLDGPMRDGDAPLSRAVRVVRGRTMRAARTRAAMLLAAVLLVLAGLVGSGMLLGAPPKTTLLATAPGGSAWVRVVVRPYDGGSAALVTASGLPNGSACQLTLIARDGTRLMIGGWRVGRQSGTWPMVGSAWVGPADVVGVDVLVAGGPELTGAVD
ncbi:MAG TPA: hypothetical protein VGM75_00565 [Pseudonocardiaceae bacterium]